MALAVEPHPPVVNARQPNMRQPNARQPGANNQRPTPAQPEFHPSTARVEKIMRLLPILK
jgi:hypothetical protein